MSAATTKAKKAKRDSKPKQDPNAINQLGLKAQALATEHQAKIGARLFATFLSSFANDLSDLVAAVPAVITARDGKVQLTAAQSRARRGPLVPRRGMRGWGEWEPCRLQAFTPHEESAQTAPATPSSGSPPAVSVAPAKRKA